MGNHNSSSHHHVQHCQSSNGLSHDVNRRGWTQSFPRELSRYHSQPAGHKVLPEPPNQRLRATNNGSIIHNGGTISGRRPSALTLPHDLNKGIFRSRSTSATNYSSSRSWKDGDHRRCNCQRESYQQSAGETHGTTDNEMQEIKRFGSEPDLRYSPPSSERNCCTRQHVKSNGLANGYYPERDSRERESRYKVKKKYKAPAPPGLSNGNGVVAMAIDGSSPDSYKWDDQQREGPRRQPPPQRRSRLFKTRAETQKRPIQSSGSCISTFSQQQDDPHNHHHAHQNGHIGNRWRHERASLKENSCSPVNKKWRLDEDYRRSNSDRWINREEPKRRSKIFDGKNTLQRSMSSPEFQAELMQVARKVRNKLFPVGKKSSPSTSLDRKREADIQKRITPNRNDHTVDTLPPYEERRIEDRIVTRVHEERRIIVERNNRIENKTTSYEEHREECLQERQPSRKIIKHEETSRKPLKETFEQLENGFQDRRGGFRNRSINDLTRTRSESPIMRRHESGDNIRGQGSGRESTPELQEFITSGRSKENNDPRWKKESKDVSDGKRWSETNAHVVVEKKEIKSKDKINRTNEVQDSNWHILPSTDKPKSSKTFYFGTDELLSKELRNHSSPQQQMDHLKSRLQSKDIKPMESTPSEGDELKNGIEDISLKLRPTLPKKQLEIPRFSPSAAWRLLSALEAPGPNMSMVSEEVPVMFEERIERLSRPPPPLVALGPRSSHDKSGDSGISGDAGAPNEDSMEVSTNNRTKTSAMRPAWTPQQDLGEESSSDAGVDSPPPMPTPVKFPPRAHVFSLSLPREENKNYIYNGDLKNKDTSAFNSLQKLKRSVSGAFGLSPLDSDKKRSNGDILDDNWLLSTSAPTSLQHTAQMTEINRQSPSGWKIIYDNEENEIITNDRTDFPMIMKPPSFSYLASGGHVMYLPESNGTVYQSQSLNYKPNPNNDKNSTKYKKNHTEDNKPLKTVNNNQKMHNKLSKEFGIVRERSFVTEPSLKTNTNKFANLSKSCENITEMKQRSTSPNNEQQQLKENNISNNNNKIQTFDNKVTKNHSKGRRFTFQSTVRQIERRRLAEKLSREAEAKERQRKSELEAMQKVEAEFERKRAREKANLKHQLRLYNMQEHNGSLPTLWDSSQLSRAEPDGAPSSAASSPTSPAPGKLANNRKTSASSEEYQRKKEHQQREYKDYRPKYYDWSQETNPHSEFKQTTVHPKVICDIPKSSPAFVDANPHGNKTNNLNTTPRSDNYRKDFAHGALAAKSSLASSDSELSQPNTRPHSRQTGGKSKPLRSRSASPQRSEEVSEEDESPVEAIKQERIPPINGFILNAVQPFVREKSYRPICFNPQPPPPVPS